MAGPHFHLVFTWSFAGWPEHSQVAYAERSLGVDLQKDSRQLFDLVQFLGRSHGHPMGTKDWCFFLKCLSGCRLVSEKSHEVFNWCQWDLNLTLLGFQLVLMGCWLDFKQICQQFAVWVNSYILEYIYIYTCFMHSEFVLDHSLGET